MNTKKVGILCDENVDRMDDRFRRELNCLLPRDKIILKGKGNWIYH